MRRKSYATVLRFALAVVISVWGAALARAAEKTYTVGYSNTADHALFDVMRKDNFQKYVEGDKSLKVVYSDANYDNKTQLDHIDNFIMQEVDAIIVVPIDYAGISVGIKRANRAGIPVICLGIESEGGTYTFVGSSNMDAGRMQGEYMVEKLPENAKVLYMEGTPGYYHSTERWEGFKAACLDKRPDIKLLSSQSGEYEKDRGMKVTEDWIQAFPEFDAIIAANDQMALGAMQALKTAGRLDDVLISGVDGVPDALDAIKRGNMAQSVLQNAPEQGRECYEALKKILKGESVPAKILIPFESITIENVDEYIGK